MTNARAEASNVTTVRGAADARFDTHLLLGALLEGDGKLFALVNGFQHPDVLTAVFSHEDDAEPLCPPERGGAHGPHLVPASRPLLAELVRGGWGHGWATYLRSDAPMEELVSHLEELAHVALRGNTDRVLRFPFYAPAIMRRVFEASTNGQRRDLLGPISSWLCEVGRGGALIRVRVTGKGGETALDHVGLTS